MSFPAIIFYYVPLIELELSLQSATTYSNKAAISSVKSVKKQQAKTQNVRLKILSQSLNIQFPGPDKVKISLR